MNIFAISDLHVDYKPNRDWVMHLSRQDFTDDVLILAGDLSHKLDLVDATFYQLSACFGKVLYVPGNHDLWVGRKGSLTSIDKFRSLIELAASHGIATTSWSHGGVSIIPLFGWYDFSFGPCCAYLKERWMDFFMCRWGEAFEGLTEFSDREKAVTDYFLAMNTLPGKENGNTVITFSHFMPRIDVMPNYIPDIHRKLYPILGSWQLDQQIRESGSTLHVYGHSHVNRHETIEGVTYINNAFGNPGEERIAAKMLKPVFTLPHP